jgi:Glucose-6-phosphate dehydrogenase subunit
MSTIHQIGPRPTDLLHAELALGELWTQAGCELHFATSNLLVVTEEHHLQRVRTVLNDLGADSSGRQVILVLDAPTLPVQAALVWVRQSYVERIEAPVTLECLGQVMSELLRPATLNHTWWACGHPPVPAVLDTLARASDQLVLDTAGLHELGQVPCLLSDLAWARTARWRELIAQLFDDPLAVAQLGDLGDASVDFRPAGLAGPAADSPELEGRPPGTGRPDGGGAERPGHPLLGPGQWPAGPRRSGVRRPHTQLRGAAAADDAGPGPERADGQPGARRTLRAGARPAAPRAPAHHPAHPRRIHSTCPTGAWPPDPLSAPVLILRSTERSGQASSAPSPHTGAGSGQESPLLSPRRTSPKCQPEPTEENPIWSSTC